MKKLITILCSVLALSATTAFAEGSWSSTNADKTQQAQQNGDQKTDAAKKKDKADHMKKTQGGQEGVTPDTGNSNGQQN